MNTQICQPIRETWPANSISSRNVGNIIFVRTLMRGGTVYKVNVL